MNKRKERLFEELKNKEYRDAFVSELINTGIPFQIRALRKQREWTQKELSEKSGMKQERISVLEDPNYAKLSLSTLKRLASAFDIGLLVKFVPFSDLVKRELTLSPDSLKALSYDEEPYFKQTQIYLTIADRSQYLAELPVSEKSDNIFYLADRPHRQEVLPPTTSVA